jgi:histidine ammonia-lyase
MLYVTLNLKQGYSDIRLPTPELLVEMFNTDIVPVVPAQGSPEEDRFC